MRPTSWQVAASKQAWFCLRLVRTFSVHSHKNKHLLPVFVAFHVNVQAPRRSALLLGRGRRCSLDPAWQTWQSRRRERQPWTADSSKSITTNYGPVHARASCTSGQGSEQPGDALLHAASQQPSPVPERSPPRLAMAPGTGALECCESVSLWKLQGQRQQYNMYGARRRPPP